jgi:hypothetical protein
MKRFSKMVSVTAEAPCATQLSAMNWACMSVGKPGIFGGAEGLRLEARRTVGCDAHAAVDRLHRAAGIAQLVDHRRRDGRRARCAAAPRRRLPPPAHKKVPASMRSATTACSQPVQFLDALDADVAWCRGLRSSRPS